MSTASTIGPVVGDPPSIEWVGVDRLAVDATYQRGLDAPSSQRIIGGMRKRWNWALCQPLSVARRDDGGLMVIDGQHRLAGARDRGDISHLPCVLARYASVQEEADTFVALNRSRAPLQPPHLFLAAVAAGEPDAVWVAEQFARAGITPARHANNASFGPRTLACGLAITKHRKDWGDEAITNALAAFVEAWPDTAIRAGASVLRALIWVYRKLPGDFDPDMFIEALTLVDGDDWVEAATDIKARRRDLSRMQAMAEAMLDAMRGRQDA